MGEKDIAEKTLEAYNDVFADIVNVLLFNGRNVVKEDELSDLTPISQYKADQKLRAQERDIAKYWKKAGVRFAIYGFENQTAIDRDMPLRMMSYDGATYRTQLDDENKDASGHFVRYPVVTLVLYFGKDPWNKPKTLYDRLKIPKELRPYVSDYKINVFEICRLTPEQVNLFQSDFRIVADYFVQTFRNDHYVPSTDTIKHVREVLELLSIVSGDPYLESSFNQLDLKRKDGQLTMESVLGRTIREKYNEGRAEGRMELLQQLIKNGILTPEEAKNY